MSEYEEFLATKRATVGSSGISVRPEVINSKLFPFQRDLVQWACRKGRAAIFADTGLGKALDSETNVITPNGLRRIGDLCIGDAVTGKSGKPTEVVGVFPQGIRPAFRVTFSDGATIVCDPDHLWAVRNKVQKFRGKDWAVLTLREIISRGLGGARSERYARWFIPNVDPVEFVESALPLHPYVLGCLIGDGCIKQGSPTISSADNELIELIGELLPSGLALEKRRYTKYDWCFGRAGRHAGRQGGHHPNPLAEILKDLGLWGHGAESKFIPDIYKFSGIDTREWILRGLLDTDGSAWESHGSSVVEYCTVSPRLADDFLFLVQSLGGKGKIGTKQTQRRLAYRIHPSFPPGFKPFQLKRKADLWHDRTKYLPTRAIKSVEPVAPVDMTCIKVSSEDGLFVTEGFVVTHNSFMQIEWSRLMGQRTLIVAPLSVAQQTQDEARKLGVSVQYVRSPSEAAGPLSITNYEMVEHFDPETFGAVVLDESSILKSLTGVTRAKLTDMFAATRYRLCCTATPAPNDIAEIANHAEFLGIMSRTEMLAMFFVHDDAGWRLKGHAEEPFYRWLASWGMSVKKPSDLGYQNDGYDLKPLSVNPVFVETHMASPGKLFFDGLKGIGDRVAVRKATLEARCAEAARLINERRGQWIAWHGLNQEGDVLRGMIPDSVLVEGAQSLEIKISALRAFQRGEIRVILTKAKIAGFGNNFQNCHQMVFVGLSDSWEAYYQCIRRCWRFGQEHPVNAWIVLSDAERQVYQNVMAKEREAEIMSARLIRHVAEYERSEIGQLDQSGDKYDPQRGISIPAWLMAV